MQVVLKMRITTAVVSLITTVVSGQPTAALKERCTVKHLQSIAGPDAVVLTASYVPAGGSYGQGLADLSYPIDGTALPELCAAIVNVTSSATSSFTFGIYLPLEWEKRFMQVGNGAFAGGINWLDMATASRYKMATVSTDCGHSSQQADSTWALNDPETLLDWGWRAIHGSLVAGKHMAAGFYQDDIEYSYYMGASTGGRQGLREIQEFPDSYDGAIIGAPGWWTSHLQPWMTRVYPSGDLGPVSQPQLSTFAEEVVRQCDAIDGVADGIISYPEQCHLDYEPLRCGRDSALNGTTCFADDQIATLKHVYGDYHTKEGVFVFPGSMVSSEAQWFPLVAGSEPTTLGYGWIRDMLLNDPTWRWQDYNDSIVAIADKTDPGRANAADFDLTDFRDGGGKIIMYHGLSDGGFSARSSQIYYENVAKTMGYCSKGGKTCGRMSSEVAKKMQSWFKFYFIPGMQHCVSSVVDAPWYINGPNQAIAFGLDVFSVPGYEDPQHDSIMSMLRWVEDGREFDTITGTAYHGQLPALGVLRQRPLCPYPAKQVYNGSGDADLEENWRCEYDGCPI